MPKGVTHKDNEAYLGDKKLTDLVQEKGFSWLVYYSLSGKEPTKEEARLFDLILGISIDHGAETPSALETIKAAKEGKTVPEAIAAGISQINDVHGGAIENAMGIFYQVQEKGLDPKDVVKEHLSEGKRIAGFGHRIYEVDTRAELLLDELAKVGDKGFTKIARGIEEELLAQKGKKLPVNIDGAIAVVLCSFGWDPVLSKSVFVVARTPGLAAQALIAKE